MTQPTVQPIYKIDSPPRLRARPFRFSTPDKRFLWIAVASIYYVKSVFNNSLLTLLAMLTVLLLMSYLTPDGRVYNLLGDWVRDFWTIVVRQNKIWQSKARPRAEDEVAPPTATATVSLTKAASKQKRSFKPAFRPIPLVVNSIGDTGLVHNYVKDDDSLIIAGNGSDFANRGIAGQHEFLRLLGESFKELSATRKVGIGISMVFRRTPVDLFYMVSNFKNSLLPEAVVPNALRYLTPQQHQQMVSEQELPADFFDTLAAEVTESDKRNLRRHRVFREMVGMSQYAGDVDMIVIVTIKREDALTKITKSDEVTVEQLLKLPISEVAETALSGLTRAGVIEPRVLNGIETEIYMRGGWDTTDLQEFYGDLGKATRKANLHWPQKRIMAWYTYCVMDNTYLSTLRIKGGPESVDSNFYQRLFGAEARYPAFCTVGETMSTRNEYRILTGGSNIVQDGSSLLGFRDNHPKAERRQQVMRARQEQAAEQSFGMDYGRYVSVAADSKKELKVQQRQIIKKIRLLGLQGSFIKGATRQKRYALTARTGINLL
jgi:hypothetical protein